jgi:TonB-linked SusC/RagA family outer membrane protein
LFGNINPIKLKFMRFYNNIYQKIRFAGLILLCVLLTGTVTAQVQKEKKVRQMVDVTLKVVDESGIPLPKVQVTIGEGIIHAETDATGSFSFRAYPEDFVTVFSAAYEKNVSIVLDIIKNNTIKLIKSKLYMTSLDEVQLPFGSVKKRNMTGSTSVINGSRLEMYPSTDLRNALTGLASGMEVREIDGQPGLSTQEYIGSFGAAEKISIMSRGRNLMWIIDNVPTDITEMPLDPNEIESVSIVKDIASKAMFGPAAADGIILVRTRRGAKNERTLNINIENGVSFIDRMPQWVSGADYATLNNLARSNDLLSTNYTPAEITAYAKNDAYDKYHPSVDFADMMLKNSMSIKRVNLSSSGGNDLVQYYTYIGYNGQGDIYKIGAKSDYNRITTRSNIDIKINDQLNIQFDFYGNLSYRRSPNYGFDSDFTSEDSGTNPVLSLIEMPSVLDDITSIPPIAFPVYSSYDSVAKTPWYGVSQAFGTNPIGELVGQGYYTETGRTGASNIALNYDMGNIIKGLKSKTYLGFNVFNLTRIGKAENYIAYIATPDVTSLGADTIRLTKSHLGYDMADLNKLMDYYYQRFAIFENLNYDRTFGNTTIKSSLTYYLAQTFKNGIEEPERQQNAISSTSLTIRDKYSLLAVFNYAGTYSFAKDKRYALFPSVGASWVISEENFMSGLKFVNFLKLRVQAGKLGNESFLSPYYYRDQWSVNTSGGQFGPVSSNQWFGTGVDNNVPRSNVSRIGNPDLTWETAKEVSTGFDALLFNGKLAVDMTYYDNVRDGQIVQVVNNLPYMLGLSSARPWYNYNKTRYYGLETGLNYSDKAGDFEYSIGGFATYQRSKRLVYDEPNYRNDYQTRVGKCGSAYFGYTYLGKFTSDAEALAGPQQKFDFILHKGDLKYADLNKDGIIDDNDQSMIGHTMPYLVYSVNSRIAYKGFELSIIGTGRALYDIALTNRYFWNGWGDNTYSAFVRDNIGGAYPKLTYYKVNNNFVNSNFWLVDGGFFKIKNVELAYNVPAKMLQFMGGRGIRVYLRGANLLTLSKVKDVDPESINSGIDRYPLFRTFTGGVKFNF